MPIPSAQETVRDFGLGLTQPAVMTPIVFGTSSLGATNALVFYADQQAMRDERGEGPAVELAANILANGGGPVGFVSADPTVAASNGDLLATYGAAGTNGAITRTGGTTGPAISLSGTAITGTYLMKVEVTTGGILGTALFKWSKNNGSTYTSGVATAASVALGTTGVTAVFPAGTYVVGEIYSWTSTGGGGTVAVSGNSALDAHLRVEMLSGGALGVATFRYSCDGYSGDTLSERTYSETLAVPSGGVFVVPGLGVTLTFVATPVFATGDVYQVDLQCAAWNATDLAECFAAIGLSSSPWRFVVPVTSKANGDATAHAVLAAALDSQLATLANGSRYRRGMIPAEQGAAASAVAAAFGSTVATRCLIAYGSVRRTTAKPFSGFAVPVTHAVDVFAARAAKSLPSTDLKRVLSGPLTEVVKIFQDEYKVPTSLDDVKISTLRTYDNVAGFYITQARLKSPNGSDFKLWPLGIVMDIACETTHQKAIFAIGRGIRYNSGLDENGRDITGTVDDRDATSIEESIATALISQLLAPPNAEGFSGYVQDLRCSVSRTEKTATTGVLRVSVGIKPHGYVDYVWTTLGFLTQLAAAA